MVDELFVSLGLDKHEWVEDSRKGESSLASYLGCIEESNSEREDRQFEEGLNSKGKRMVRYVSIYLKSKNINFFH